ncbi:hypothetical protein CPB86DRAFT_780318 [Serendipita vermifera]|nr:hypothetical protein CPB86DRAFT_780318 [Serendipita vermifera]
MLRLIAHGFPKAGLVVSVYLPLGPCGQGGYAILLLSRQYAALVSAAGIADADIYGKIVTVMGTGVSLTLWAIGLWFGITSTIGLVEVCIRTSVPFRVNFWGMIFPNGVYSLLTLQLGKDLDSYFFRILGTTFSAITAILWAFIAVKSSWLAFEGEIFQAPCLDDASLNMPWHTPPIDVVDMSSIIDERRERTPS